MINCKAGYFKCPAFCFKGVKISELDITKRLKIKDKNSLKEDRL